jgi:hypothetical protein
MDIRRLKVLIPEDHRLVVELPDEVPAGPAEIILLVTPPASGTDPLRASEGDRARFLALSKELRADPRPFRELSADERRARLCKIAGSGRSLFSTSDEFRRWSGEDGILTWAPGGPKLTWKQCSTLMTCG